MSARAEQTLPADLGQFITASRPRRGPMRSDHEDKKVGMAETEPANRRLFPYEFLGLDNSPSHDTPGPTHGFRPPEVPVQRQPLSP